MKSKIHVVGTLILLSALVFQDSASAQINNVNNQTAGKITGGDEDTVATGRATELPPPVSTVTAPLCANARPSRVEPVRSETDTAARMLP